MVTLCITYIQCRLSVQNIMNTCSLHDVDWLGESYDAWLVSSVKSTSIRVDEGEETGWRRIFKLWDNWDMYCVCVPFRGWMGKTKYWSAFERGMVEGARRTGFCQELQRCWVFYAQQFPVCIKIGPPPKGHTANLTQLWETLVSTWASITVECFRYLLVRALTKWGCSEGKGRWNAMLGILRVRPTICYDCMFTVSTKQ